MTQIAPFRCPTAVPHWALARMLAMLTGLLLLAGVGTEAQAAGYRVGTGDVLSVSIFGYADISGEHAVREDGSIALHLLGRIEAAGRTVPEVEEEIAQRARDAFQSEPSVVVSITAYRDVFVTGGVDVPGAYPFRPGLTVIKAVALAGGMRRVAQDENSAQRLLDVQRRAEQARTRMANAQARIEAIDAEIRRPDGDDAAPRRLDGVDGADTAVEAATPEGELVATRRALLRRSVEQARRQSRLAEEEAESMQQRRLLIQNQREAVAEQRARIEELVERGLARREQLLDLEITADNYRAEELESTAFESRARQTAANAESQIELERTRYRQDLLSDRIDTAENLALARAEYRAAAVYLRSIAGAVPNVGETASPVYEILRRNGAQIYTLAANETTLLHPDDVLRVIQPLPEALGANNP